MAQYDRDNFAGSHGGRGGYRGRGGGDGGFRGRGRGGFRPRSGLGFKKSYSDEVREEVENLFTKKFRFKDEHEEWTLPATDTMFKEEPFIIRRLIKLKEQLNSTKEKLNDKEMMSWHRHTYFTNRAGIVLPAVRRDYNPEMCTQGWAKFHEILLHYGSLVSEATTKLHSVHLCEAPGGFIASLNHFLKTHRMDCDWWWRAMTLNPYYEGNGYTALIDQDKFMSETWDRWFLGGDNSGDVMVWRNMVEMRSWVKEEMGDVHLVTADGSSNCADNPGEQEAALAQLLYCETVSALLLLKTGGSFVLKTFTTLESATICLMYLLACSFTELHVFKPVTSKAGHSEQYVICIGYKGTAVLSQEHLKKLSQEYGDTPPDTSMFSLSSLPPSFLSQMIECCGKFTKYQMDMIEENIRLYDCMKASEKHFIQEVKELTCDTYKSRFVLKELPRGKAVVQNMFLNGSQLYSVGPLQGDPTQQWLQRRSTESFIARMEQRRKTWSERNLADQEPHPKQPRITSGESAAAVQHVLRCLGFDGSDSKSISDSFLLELQPDELQWTKGPTNKPMSPQELKSLDGKAFSKVESSKFCRPDILKKLSEAVTNAQILQTANLVEFTHTASFMLPGHSLYSTTPFYFSPNAVHFAALDSLLEFSNKPDMSQMMKMVDLAGAPSEFTHYVYWKRQRMIKGWGMVRVENPKLGAGRVVDQLAPWESFQVLGPHSGVNICDTNSIKSLCAGVENYSPGGVHLLIGDASPLPHGAHAPGHAETLTKQQLLAQCICACRVLQMGGMFICRVYEFFSRFTASLAYILYRVFEEVIILKPMTSCPTSPERFLICRGFVGCKSIVTEMLLEVNSHIAELRPSVSAPKLDVLEIVPMQQLLGEEQFYRFLTLSNERIARHRTQWIIRLEKALLDSEYSSSEEDRTLLRKGTLEILQLPALATPSLPPD